LRISCERGRGLRKCPAPPSPRSPRCIPAQERPQGPFVPSPPSGSRSASLAHQPDGPAASGEAGIVLLALTAPGRGQPAPRRAEHRRCAWPQVFEGHLGVPAPLAGPRAIWVAFQPKARPHQSGVAKGACRLSISSRGVGPGARRKSNTPTSSGKPVLRAPSRAGCPSFRRGPGPQARSSKVRPEALCPSQAEGRFCFGPQVRVDHGESCLPRRTRRRKRLGDFF